MMALDRCDRCGEGFTSLDLTRNRCGGCGRTIGLHDVPIWANPKGVKPDGRRYVEIEALMPHPEERIRVGGYYLED